MYAIYAVINKTFKSLCNGHKMYEEVTRFYFPACFIFNTFMLISIFNVLYFV